MSFLQFAFYFFAMILVRTERRKQEGATPNATLLGLG